MKIFISRDLCRVRKSKNFPVSKTFVAKTYQIKRRNRVNFQLSRLSRCISRSYRLFLDSTDTYSRLSGHFLHRLETFQFIQTLFRSPRHFPVHPDTLHIVWILPDGFAHLTPSELNVFFSFSFPFFLC